MKFRMASGAAFAAVLWLASADASAAGPGAVRKQVEASMLVTGRIQVDAAGKVIGYSLDEQHKLPAGVVGILGQEVPTWTFEPVLVAGKPAHVTTEMSVRLVAKKRDADSYSVVIRSAGFGDAADKRSSLGPKAAREAGATANKVCSTGLRPPSYPENAAQSGVGANVYLLVKSAPDGKVLDVAAEQVNLKVVASERGMERWRRVFADVAMSQARKWCVEPPARDDAAAKDGFHIVRVPVVFHLDGMEPAYGRWEAYVPGPRASNPWRQDDEGPGFSPDALSPGRAHVAGAGLKLLTRLSGS